ncbi:mechanosensitive ion channel family protein [Luteimonas sp. A277]
MAIDWGRYLHWLEQTSLKLLGAALILLVGVWLARRLSQRLELVLKRIGAESTVSSFLRYLSYAAMLVVAVVAALQQFGVPVASIVAVLGAAGLAIALAMKDSLSNIAAGIMLVVLRPFREGDVVQVAGQEGTVEHIRVFQTRLRTADNRVVVLPNSSITTAAIVNFTAYPRRRFEIPLLLDYRDDPEQARDALLELAGAHPGVIDDPAPAVVFNRLGENGVELTLFAWAKSYELGSTRSDLLLRVHSRLQEMGMNPGSAPRDVRVFHHDPQGAPLPQADRPKAPPHR